MNLIPAECEEHDVVSPAQHSIEGVVVELAAVRMTVNKYMLLWKPINEVRLP